MNKLNENQRKWILALLNYHDNNTTWRYILKEEIPLLKNILKINHYSDVDKKMMHSINNYYYSKKDEPLVKNYKKKDLK